MPSPEKKAERRCSSDEPPVVGHATSLKNVPNTSGGAGTTTIHPPPEDEELLLLAPSVDIARAGAFFSRRRAAPDLSRPLRDKESALMYISPLRCLPACMIFRT
jgi:hypothetical protein